MVYLQPFSAEEFHSNDSLCLRTWNFLISITKTNIIFKNLKASNLSQGRKMKNDTNTNTRLQGIGSNKKHIVQRFYSFRSPLSSSWPLYKRLQEHSSLVHNTFSSYLKTFVQYTTQNLKNYKINSENRALVRSQHLFIDFSSI